MHTANLYYSYLQQHRYDDALREFAKFAAMNGYPQGSIDAISEAYRRGGIKGFWREQLKLNANKRIPALDDFDLASVYAALGENAKALDYLDKAYDEREPKMGFLSVLPELRGLRAEPKKMSCESKRLS